jgi:hypothetical protein
MEMFDFSLLGLLSMTRLAAAKWDHTRDRNSNSASVPFLPPVFHRVNSPQGSKWNSDILDFRLPARAQHAMQWVIDIDGQSYLKQARKLEKKCKRTSARKPWRN